MKISVTIGTTDAYSKALVVFRGLEESLPIIADLGYDGIELAIWKKDNVNIKKLKQLLKRYKLSVPVFSTGQMYTMLGLSFTSYEKNIRNEAISIFKGIIDIASEFGSSVNISRVRGSFSEEETYQEGIKRLTECLYILDAYAKKRNINLVLEQMNRYETNIMMSIEEIGEYIKKMYFTNILIHADTFHMNIEDKDMCGNIKKYKELIGYLHFADSNRLSPGMGHIDFKSIIKTLKEIQYSGWIGIEVFTEPDPVGAANSAIQYIKNLM